MGEAGKGSNCERGKSIYAKKLNPEHKLEEGKRLIKTYGGRERG